MTEAVFSKWKQRAQANRTVFPFAARILDELRAELGDGPRIVFAEEGGRTIRGAMEVTTNERVIT